MYRAITNEIEVSVEPFYLEDRSSPEEHHYVWGYRITIANHSDQPVKLMARHWRITDAHGKIETVDGAGVVGEQPELDPGDSFQYTSGCPLATPSGFMVGTYDVRGDDGDLFTVDIPAFSLDSPDERRRLN